MSKIFLSYRRQDSIGVAGRIYDRLRAHFGDNAIFMDIDSIPFGEDFREHIDAAVGQCDVVLVVIGTNWAGETGAHRRLDDPRDFVRIEIESALQRDIPVIPVLIDHARMPAEADLPPSLTRLTYRNAIDVDQGRDFHPHVDRLVQGIEFHVQRAKILAVPPSSEPGKPVTPLPNATEEHQARRHSDPSRSDQRLRADPAGTDGSTSTIPTKPATSHQLYGTYPKRNIPWLWFCVVALPVLAFLGINIYKGTVNISGTAPNMTLEGGNKEPATQSPNVTGGSKPASATTQLRSPAPESPPSQPGREWKNSIGIRLIRIEAGEFLMGSAGLRSGCRK